MPQGEQPTIELNLGSYVGVIRRQIATVIAVTVLVCGAATAAALAQTPKYRTSATLFVGRSAAAQFVDPLTGAEDPFRRLANEIRILQGQGVADAAARRLGYRAGISASGSQTEDVITITAVDTDAKRAAKTANTYASVYIQYRKTAGAFDTRSVEQQLSGEIDKLQAQLDQIDAAKSSPTTRTDTRRDALVAQISALRQQLAQLQLGAALDAPAEVLSRAGVPSKPFEPKPLRNAGLGFVVGVLLGLGVALLRDYLDDTIRSPEELSAVAHDLPLLAQVPVSPEFRKFGDNVLGLDPYSSAAESFRALRTSVQFMYRQDGESSPRVVLFSSAMPGEGKSVTVASLALALARAGNRVVAVDADLRRPRLGPLLSVPTKLGLSSVLTGTPLTDALATAPGMPGLFVLGSGPMPNNPSELLSSDRFASLVVQLSNGADIVLIDSPPVLPVTDAAILSEHADAVILLAMAEKSSRKQLRRAIAVLRQVRAQLAGFVLIGGDPGFDYYGYTYEQRHTGGVLKRS